MERRNRILIVDDDAGTCQVLELLFSREGLETEVTSTGSEALEKAQLSVFDVALLDDGLPDIRGVELLTQLRRLCPHTDVLIITGNTSAETAIEALNRGAAGYITKPLDIERVLADVKDLFKRQRLIAEKQSAEKALEDSEHRYRGLFENVPISLWLEDYSGVKMYIDELRNEGITDLVSYFKSHPRAVAHCATLAQILDVNQATIELFEAKSKADLIGPLSRVFRPESYQVFRKQILALASGQSVYSAVIVNRTSTGRMIHVSFNMSLAPGAEETWSRVLVSLTEITQQVEAETALRAERDRAQQYLDIAGAVMLALNASGEITLVNRRGQAILGYSEEQLLGRDWFETCLPTRIRAKARQDFDHLMAGSSLPNTYSENPILTKSGEQRIIAWHNTVLKDSDGSLVGTLSSGEDITERLRASHEVEERRQYLERILAAAPDAIVTLDANHKIAEWNPGAERLFGYTSAEVVGTDLDALVANTETMDEARRFSKAISEGIEVGPVETVRYRKDGSPVKVILSGSRILMGQELAGSVIVYADVTQLSQARETLQRRYRELETLYEAATAISSDLSLEFVLKTVAEQLTRALESSGCALSLWNRESAQVEILVDYRQVSPEKTEPAGTRYDLCEFPTTRRVLETSKPIFIQRNDLDSDKADSAFRARKEASAMLMLPLVARDRVLGLAELVDQNGRREFSADEIRLAESLAAQAAIAIENARLYDESRREIVERARAEEAIRHRSRELDLLNRVIMAATSTLDTNHVLQVTCRELANAFNLPQAAAVLLNADATEGTVVAECCGDGRPSRMGATLPLAALPLAEDVLERPKPYVVKLGQRGSRPADASDLVHDADARSLLGVPIVLARGRVAGAIVLTRVAQPDFTAREGAVAQNVAAAVGQALETARLYEALRRNVESLEETVAQRTVELGVALERAKDADRVKSEFVSNVSHELRTPLTSLKLYLSLLANANTEKRQNYLNVLRRETDRLQDLIEALLDISRLDLGKTQVHLLPTDLNQLVRVLSGDRGALAASNGLGLDVVLTKDLPLVHADPKLLEQVLTNLLTNAINYTPSGGKITLSTAFLDADGEQWITASVSDTGPGIPEDERERLFERFFRGLAGRASAAPGTGLGLAICKQIMDLNHGKITLESDGIPGRGSTFTIHLPPTESPTLGATDDNRRRD